MSHPLDYCVNSKICIDSSLGYEYFIDQEHPLSNSQGKVYYHRHVASVKKGRWLKQNEHVHHKNQKRSDNRVENLEVLEPGDHFRTHFENKVTKKCKNCGERFECVRSNRGKRKHCSVQCRSKQSEVINWPKTKWLKEMADEYSYLALSRRLGVSDNAIRKRIRNH